MFFGDKKRIQNSHFKLVCSRCGRCAGMVDTFNALPDYFTCKICGAKLETLPNTFLVEKREQNGEEK
jgi:rRNA maturation endonuclease Nob1